MSSYSRIKSYNDCRLRYKLVYLEKKAPEEGDALEVGSAAHAFFEHWHSLIKAEPKYKGDMAMCATIAAQCWADEARNPELFNEFLGICKRFAQDYEAEKGWDSSLAEVPLSFDADWKPCDWANPKAHFRAKLDRLEIKGSKARVTDYKTGYAGNVDGFQTEIYAFLVGRSFPQVKTVEMVYHFPRSGHKTSKTISVDDAQIVWTQLEAELLAMAEETDYKAKPGQRCSNCPVAHLCTYKADIKRVSNEGEARLALEELLVLEARTEILKKQLKTYAQANGDVKSNGMVAGFVPSQTLSYPAMIFAKTLEALGISPWSCLKTDSRAVARLFKENEEAASVLAPHAEVTSAVSFRIKKAKEDSNGE